MKQEWMTALVVIGTIIFGMSCGFGWYLFYIILKDILMAFPVNWLIKYAPPNTDKTTNPLTTNTEVVAFYTKTGFVAEFPEGGTGKDWKDYAIENTCAGIATNVYTDASFKFAGQTGTNAHPPCYWPTLIARS